VKGFFIFVGALVALMWWGSENVTEPKILQYAKDQKSDDWTPRLEYWTGLVEYTRSDWAGTITAYEQLLTDYPTGYYSPLATLKLADSYYHVARRQDAVAQYQHYLDQWPDGEQANLAKKSVELLSSP
jgi:TolA-binding protein